MKSKYSRLLTVLMFLTSLAWLSSNVPVNSGSLVPSAAANPAIPPQTDACGPKCGTERWSVKTLTDADHASVKLQPKKSSVSWLVSQDEPDNLPANNRISPVETQTYRVEGQLVGFKNEADHDFHIVIADPTDATATMIVEVPDPSCSGACASPAIEDIRKARQDFVDHCGKPTSGFKRLQKPLIVTVTGVGFFDFLHGQTGVADNGIELHPVLKIEFPTDTNECETFAKSRRSHSRPN